MEYKNYIADIYKYYTQLEDNENNVYASAIFIKESDLKNWKQVLKSEVVLLNIENKEYEEEI